MCARFVGSFDIFAAGRAAGRCERDTGFSDYILGLLWTKYGEFMPNPPRGHPDKAQAYFFLCFKFIKHAPRPSHVTATMWTPHTGCISTGTYRRQIEPRLLILGMLIDEIHWSDRLSPFNHTVHFPGGAVGLLDSLPLVISTPSDWRAASKYFQGKYNNYVLKVQIIIDFNGNIVWCSLPHLGTRSDPKMWEAWHPHFNAGEYVLADGAYISCSHCLVPYQAPANQVLTQDQDWLNAVIQLYRARVEQIISNVKNFELWRSKCRSGGEVTVAMAKICIHATALQLREQSEYKWRYQSTMPDLPRPHF